VVLAGFRHCPQSRRFFGGSERGVGDRIISGGLWPARSPGITTCDIYLWCNFKKKIYRTNAHEEEELKKNMERNFASSSGRTSSLEFQPI
jgi:hypothetical protein